MKKKFFIVIVTVLTFAIAAKADETQKKLTFLQFGLDYATVISPEKISNNDTGVYDTPAFNAKAGIDLFKWVDLYAAVSFLFFADSYDTSNHYTFIPIRGGIRVNAFPDIVIYPSLFFEYGKSISNRHTVTKTPTSMTESDAPWTGDYYNFGFGINWNSTDMTVLTLNIERPAIKEKESGEIHVLQIGMEWKIDF